jgi:hypothetical protein
MIGIATSDSKKIVLSIHNCIQRRIQASENNSAARKYRDKTKKGRKKEEGRVEGRKEGKKGRKKERKRERKEGKEERKGTLFLGSRTKSYLNHNIFSKGEP